MGCTRTLSSDCLQRDGLPWQRPVDVHESLRYRLEVTSENDAVDGSSAGTSAIEVGAAEAPTNRRS